MTRIADLQKAVSSAVPPPPPQVTRTRYWDRKREQALRLALACMVFVTLSHSSQALTYTVGNMSSTPIYKLFIYNYTTSNQLVSYVVTNVPIGQTTYTLPTNASYIAAVRLRCAGTNWPILLYLEDPTDCGIADGIYDTSCPPSWQTPNGQDYCYGYQHVGTISCLDDGALRISDGPCQ